MEERKRAHVDLAFQSRVLAANADTRFYYEPLLSAHPVGDPRPFDFAGKTMLLPVWVSSMTGGTALAGQINRNLARACAEFGMGMGLGSCRVLMDNPRHLPDFDVRHIIGNKVPFYANLGIAQLEQLVNEKAETKIEELVDKLQADGIIIHVNPLQEAFQQEGDLLQRPPVETLQDFMESTRLRVIVKEVGQGMGPASLEALLKLPLQAIEFGALGGTNFTKLEIARLRAPSCPSSTAFENIGHTAPEMVQMVNEIVKKIPPTGCNQIIISGGIDNIIDGYYLVKTSTMKAVFGMGSAFLKHSMGDYDTLEHFVSNIKLNLSIANSYLKIR